MGSAKEYRVIAQDCLRMAVIKDERDRPLWVTMAQSWIQLAEHVAKLHVEPEDTADSEGDDHRSSDGDDHSPGRPQTAN